MNKRHVEFPFSNLIAGPNVKSVAYFYGLLCVSVGIAFAAYFPTLFALEFVSKFVPTYLEKVLVYLFLAIPVVLALLYLVRAVSKLKAYGVPESFKGWRFVATILGILALVLGTLPILISLISKPTTGSMSGVPVGVGLIFSLVLVLPAMATPRK